MPIGDAEPPIGDAEPIVESSDVVQNHQAECGCA